MEKKEENRYVLVSYHSPRTKIVDSKEEYDELVKECKRYNARKYSKNILGNITYKVIEGGKLEVTSQLYEKLTPKMTISELIELTSKYSEKELLDFVHAGTPSRSDDFTGLSHMETWATPDVNIAYFETKNKDEEGIRYDIGVSYLPVFYKEDMQYLDMKYVERCVSYHASKKNYTFFFDLISQLEYNHSCLSEIEDLEITINRVRYEGYSYSQLEYNALKLIRAYIVERDRDGSILRKSDGHYQYSKRRIVDIGTFIKYFGSNRKSALCYNEKMNRGKANQRTLK